MTAPARRRCPERGSAVVEFTFLSVLVLVPLIYLVLMLARLHAASFAVTLASREAGRAFVTAPAESTAHARAEAAAALAFADHDLADGGRVSITCSHTPCLVGEQTVNVTAQVSVPIPMVPEVVAQAVPSSVTITSSYVAVVDRFRGQL